VRLYNLPAIAYTMIYNLAIDQWE